MENDDERFYHIYEREKKLNLLHLKTDIALNLLRISTKYKAQPKKIINDYSQFLKFLEGKDDKQKNTTNRR